ncbi:M23 family metallopeptidase [Candidatus Gottesmanbacteria bacterium]|nr:M23 family metallopeptidase [Candidatus Gottesmanbacteria bacterium]
MKQLIARLTRHYRGSHILSLFLRKKIEKLHVRQVLGVNLASLAFIAAVVVPQAEAISSQVEVMRETVETIVEVVPTIARFQWPMNRFGLTSRFSSGHPGLDLTAPKGNPIKAIAQGTVQSVITYPFGFGRHIIIAHDQGASSLYAHLSRINVSTGDTITRDTVIGEVGSTGWSTGNHLHLEIYQDGAPVNPLDALPTLSLP